jgi:GT2 family glycosyltransferase
MFDLSFIIVGWNARELLAACLHSLSSEAKGERAEIIVVDNASTDGSAEHVEKHFPGIRLIRNRTNLGFARANNIGIRNSAGKYVCLLNSDVQVRPGAIARMREYLDRHPAAGILGPRVLRPDGTLQPSCRSLPNLWNTFCRALALDTAFPKSQLFRGEVMSVWEHEAIRSVEVLCGCFWMVRREAMNQIGLLDESFFIYAEDLDWCKRFRKAGWQNVYFPEAEVVHFGGGSSSNAPLRFFIEMQRALAHFWEKHHSRPAYGLFLIIQFLHHSLRALSHLLLYPLQASNRNQAAFRINRHIAALRWLCDRRAVI